MYVKEAIMKKIFFMMCLLITSTLCVFAQSGTVKGKVADKSTDESFPYVTVVVKDATRGIAAWLLSTGGFVCGIQDADEEIYAHQC